MLDSTNGFIVRRCKVLGLPRCWEDGGTALLGERRCSDGGSGERCFWDGGGLAVRVRRSCDARTDGAASLCKSDGAATHGRCSGPYLTRRWAYESPPLRDGDASIRDGADRDGEGECVSRE
ncbi:hypothetical protein PIB30_026167 [Stylosanthes scabra]|uniref:Uncharacterized protein n=1 Tax=Stylosanthes scabra TaxID=79078 RepID=A0ABU6WC67_9FABA|nr:hypothetical protein [Stylosanthes scabra]